MKKSKQEQTKQSKALNYIKESMGELKKVSWPRKEEVVNSTIIVITVIVVISIVLSLFDIGVGEAVKYLFKPVTGSFF